MAPNEVTLGEPIFVWPDNWTRREPYIGYAKFVSLESGKIVVGDSTGIRYDISKCYHTIEAAYAGKARLLMQEAHERVKLAREYEALANPSPAIPADVLETVPLKAAA